jgi:hypothetical protein
LNTFESHKQEIRQRIIQGETARLRALHDESPLLKQLQTEQRYWPPHPKCFPGRITQAQELAAGRAADAASLVQERKRIVERHAELSGLMDEQQRLLEALTPFAEPDDAAKILRRLEGIIHLRAVAEMKLSEPEPEEEATAPRLAITSEEARAAEVNKLRAWMDRLQRELRRIQAELGDAAEGSASWSELAAIVFALHIAQENLSLAPPPLRLLGALERQQREEALHELSRRHNARYSTSRPE